MNDRLRLLFLILILAFVGTFVAGVTNYLLYNAAFEQNRERLVVTASSQARLIEAVVRHEVEFDKEGKKGIIDTVALVKQFYENFEEIGETGEFTLAHREKDQIIFLFRQRHQDLETPEPIPFDSGLAQPMRLALSGQSGTLVGLDYRGETVLAAFEPIAMLNLGIVAKIDLAEIRAPFVETGIITGILALLAILAGAFLFVRTNQPILRKIQEGEAKYRNLFEHANDSIFIIDPKTNKFLEANLIASTRLGYTRKELLQLTVEALHPPSEFSRVEIILNQIRDKGSIKFESIHLRKNGSEIKVEISSSWIKDDDQYLIQNIVRDITERSRVEELLRANEKRFRGLIENSVQPQVVVQDWKPVFVNQAFVDQFRFGSREEVLALPNLTMTMLPQDVAEISHQHIDDLKGNITRPHFERVGVRADGTQMPIEVMLELTEWDDSPAVLITYSDITEKKLAEEALKEKTFQLNSILTSLVDGVVSINEKGTILTVNPATERIFGYKEEELLGQNIKILMPSPERKKHDGFIKHFINTGEAKIIGAGRIVSGRRKDGTVFSLDLAINEIPGTENIRKFTGIMRDITDRIKIEEALHSSQILLQTVFETLPVGLQVKDRSGRYLMVNSSMAALYGKSQDDFIGRTFADLGVGTETQIQQVLEDDRRVMETGENIDSLDAPLLLPDGETIWRRKSKAPLRDATGATIGIVGVLEDITKRRLIEEDLQASEAKYRLLIDGSIQGIAIIQNLNLIFTNRALAEMYGYDDPEKLIGQDTMKLFVAPHERKRIKNMHLARLRGEDVPNRYEFQGLRKDGSLIWLECLVTSMNWNGQSAAQVTFYDITERKQAEEEVRSNQERLRTLVDTIPHWIYIKDKENRYTMVNRAFAEFYGMVPEEFLGMHTRDVPGRSASQIDQFMQSDWMLFGEGQHSFSGNQLVISPSGEERTFRTVKTPLRDKEDNIVGLVGISEDITEGNLAEEKIKLQQEQLIQADKMATLGTLVSGVAHEINNPNAIITLNAPSLKAFWEDVLPILDAYQASNGEITLASIPYDRVRKDLPAMLEDIQGGANRIKTIVENLRDFSRQGANGTRSTISLNKVVESAVVLIGAKIRKATHSFNSVLAEELPMVKANFQELEQVVINLITNSCDALESPEKSITISTVFDSETQQAKIIVTDEGEGIAQENISRVKDPFFTTKRESGGTGLGLSVSQGIIENHSGSLEFSSPPEGGVIATIALPVLIS